MSYYIRKIELAKWNLAEGDTCPNDIGADAITSCLRTGDNNGLSVWEITSIARTQIDDIAIAFATSIKSECSFQFIIIDSSLIQGRFNIIESPGTAVTKYEYAKQSHRSIRDLTYEKIGEIASIIYDIIKEDNDTKLVRYTRAQLNNTVVDAIESKKITKDCFTPQYIDKIGVRLTQ
jgi:hypothetical protein